MRWIPLFFLLTSISAMAQQSPQTDERMSKILNPDLNSTANLSGKSFYGGRDFNTQPAYSRPFYFSSWFKPKKFDAKTYSPGTYWTGEYSAGNEKGLTSGKYAVPNLTTKVAVKDSAVRTSPEAGKTQAVRDYSGSRPYLGQEKKKMDRSIDPSKPLPGWTGEGKVMTMEELRDLLNKTR